MKPPPVPAPPADPVAASPAPVDRPAEVAGEPLELLFPERPDSVYVPAAALGPQPDVGSAVSITGDIDLPPLKRRDPIRQLAMALVVLVLLLCGALYVWLRSPEPAPDGQAEIGVEADPTVDG